MTSFFSRRKNILLLLGDTVAIFVIVLIGFATHGETISTRLLATFLPALASWFLVSPWFRVFGEPADHPSAAWRAAFAAVIAMPLATILRGFWLGSLVVPVFAVVLGGTLALGMGIWRLIWVFVNRTRGQAWMKSA